MLLLLHNYTQYGQFTKSTTPSLPHKTYEECPLVLHTSTANQKNSLDHILLQAS